jgi:hypothetical protein
MRITPRESTLKPSFYNNRLVKESTLLEVIWSYSSNYQYQWKWDCTNCPKPVDYYVDVVSPRPRVSTNQVPQPTPAPIAAGASTRYQIQVLGKCNTAGRRIRFTAYLIEPNGQLRQTESAYVTVAGYTCPPGGAPGGGGNEPPPTGDGPEIFEQMARVFDSPRCGNCHQAGSAPKVDDTRVAHPLDRGRQVRRGDGTCSLCHDPNNPPLSSAGHGPKPPPGTSWKMPPPSMAFAGLSTGDICRSISDPAKNGGRSLADILDHMRNDHLVDWSFTPRNHDGSQRTPAGVKSQFLMLMQQWVNAGGGCP